MAGRTLGQRVDRLERVVQIIAEDQVSLQKLIAGLATETRRGFDRVAAEWANDALKTWKEFSPWRVAN